MEQNVIFNNAKFGDRFLTRDEHIAIYGRRNPEGDKHILLVNDYHDDLKDENDYILVFDDGHLFHINEYKDDVFKKLKLNKEEMKNYRLDVIKKL